MTAKQIQLKISGIYPHVACSVPIFCLGLPFEDNYNEYRIQTNEDANKHGIIGQGRTPKKAWINALENISKNK